MHVYYRTLPLDLDNLGVGSLYVLQNSRRKAKTASTHTPLKQYNVTLFNRTFTIEFDRSVYTHQN